MPSQEQSKQGNLEGKTSVAHDDHVGRDLGDVTVLECDEYLPNALLLKKGEHLLSQTLREGNHSIDWMFGDTVVVLLDQAKQCLGVALAGDLADEHLQTEGPALLVPLRSIHEDAVHVHLLVQVSTNLFFVNSGMMGPMLIDGRKIASEIARDIEGSILHYNLFLKLLVIQVGDDPATESFIKAKNKFAEKVGINVEVAKFDNSASTAELVGKVKEANDDKSISGIIVQLPLPSTIDTSEVLDAIAVEKDPDLLSSMAKAQFAKGDSSILPPVVGAIEQIVDDYDINLFESDVAIVGFGKLVGEPTATWLRNLGVEYVVVTSDNTDQGKILRAANLIISGVGKPGLIKPEMINESTVVIDAGTSESPDSPTSPSSGLVGDCDPACYDKARLITPVPGGVGPIAVAILFRNLLELSMDSK